MRVFAENSIPCACLRSKSKFAPNFSASRTMDLPSVVSSKILAAKATLAISVIEWPLIGINSSAKRLPRVIVPVLSRTRVLISPQASMALPEVAMTLNCATRSMPAIPMVLSNPPIVVGMSATKRAIRTGTLTGLLT